LTLVKFRIWTRPTEVVAIPGTEGQEPIDRAVKFYINNIKILTDTFESLFDGDSLSNPEVYREALGGKK
jgi:hypothetical protein